MDYHRYARQIAQERIQAGQAASRRQLTNPSTVRVNEQRGSLRAWLLARLRTPLVPRAATRSV
jgi:hypothetical protein